MHPCRRQEGMAIRNLTRAIQGVLCGVILASAAAAAQVNASAENLAPTPPMGWASWNYYFCNYDEQTIKDQADALVSSGMRDLGYRYLIIQECIAPTRDEHGQLVPDAKRFPHGIPALVDYIHARGLKAGIYTDVGPAHLLLRNALPRQLRPRNGGCTNVRRVENRSHRGGLL